MLTKGFHLALESQDIKPFMDTYLRAQEIMLSCWGKPTENEGERMPGCHEVAYAFEKAFGVPAVHGRKFFITTVKKLGWMNYFKSEVSNYVHSWNVLTLPSGKQVIIDIFPNETCSVSPIILPCPHAAYVPGPINLAKRIEMNIRRPEYAATVDYFATEFERITKKI